MLLKDFKKFTSNLDPNFHEVYELYSIANPTSETSVLFTKTADRNTPNVIITSLNGEQLLLTPKSAVALRQWLQKEYMHGEDAESYYAMELAMEKAD